MCHTNTHHVSVQDSKATKLFALTQFDRNKMLQTLKNSFIYACKN